MRSKLVTLLAGLLLSGCGQTLWDKPGATPAEFSQDSARCRLIARGLNPGGFYASGSPEFVAGAALGNAIGTAASQMGTYNDCMMASGYTPESPNLRASVDKIRPVLAHTAACISALYGAPAAEPIRRHAPFNPAEASPTQLSDPSFATADEVAAITLLYPQLQECRNNTLSQLSGSMPALVPILAQEYAASAERITLLKERKITWGRFNKEGHDDAMKVQNQARAALQNGN